jgi:hypothetical protein
VEHLIRQRELWSPVIRARALQRLAKARGLCLEMRGVGYRGPDYCLLYHAYAPKKRLIGWVALQAMHRGSDDVLTGLMRAVEAVLALDIPASETGTVDDAVALRALRHAFDHELVARLTAAGYDAWLRDPNLACHVAFICAIGFGNGAERARLLARALDAGARLNHCRLLPTACMFGQLDVVELLLSRGADPHRRHDLGLLPVQLAALSGYGLIVDALHRAGSMRDRETELVLEDTTFIRSVLERNGIHDHIPFVRVRAPTRFRNN